MVVIPLARRMAYLMGTNFVGEILKKCQNSLAEPVTQVGLL
jgi:hypothetical protein